MTPVHTHDCLKCQYLETTPFNGKTVDWYLCPEISPKGSLIGRYGDFGPAYWSSPVGLVGMVDSPWHRAALSVLRRFLDQSVGKTP